MKYCRSFWTKKSIQGINNHWIFRFAFNTKFTACFLHYNLWGSKLWNIKVNKHRKDHFTLLKCEYINKNEMLLESWTYVCISERERQREGWGTFEKWYSSGNIILRAKFPSLDETPSTTMVCVSGDDRLLRRFKDRDFDTGGLTPFSSKVRSSGSSLFKSRYLITLLFVSAMRNLPAAWQKIPST